MGRTPIVIAKPLPDHIEVPGIPARLILESNGAAMSCPPSGQT